MLRYRTFLGRGEDDENVEDAVASTSENTQTGINQSSQSLEADDRSAIESRAAPRERPPAVKGEPLEPEEEFVPDKPEGSYRWIAAHQQVDFSEVNVGVGGFGQPELKPGDTISFGGPNAGFWKVAEGKTTNPHYS